MKCRSHPSDQSAGVCPSCLRERLSALTASSSRSDFPVLEIDLKKPRSSISNIGFFALIIARWKKNKKKFPHNSPVKGRGMSPVMNDEIEDYGTRIQAPARRKVQRQQSYSSLSSYAICLSPMLRPSYGNRRRFSSPEMVFSGDVKGGLNRMWSGVGRVVPDGFSGLGLNRSRKLVDLGKAW